MPLLLPAARLHTVAGVCEPAKLRHAACAAPAAQAAGAGRLLGTHQQQRATTACSQRAAGACRQGEVGNQPRQHGRSLQRLGSAALAAAEGAPAAALHAVQRAAHEQGVAVLAPLLAGRQAQQLRIAQLQPARGSGCGAVERA